MANEFLCHEFIVYTECIRRQDLLGTLNAFGLYRFSSVFIVLSHHDTFGQHNAELSRPAAQRIIATVDRKRKPSFPHVSQGDGFNSLLYGSRYVNN
jgi:hypothetical protein